MAINFTGLYSENFDSLANAGTINTFLPTGWEITESGGGSRDNEQYAADTGGSNTGDTYSYGAASSPERALGGLQSGTLVPTFGTSFTNNTSSAIEFLNVAYTGEQWRLGTVGRADRLDFQYSLDATSLTTGTWVNVDTLDFTSPTTTSPTGVLDGNAITNRTAVSATIANLNIPVGATFWFRWNSFDAAGADDGLAIDDFSISTNVTPPPATTLVTIAATDAAAAEAGLNPGTFRITRTGDTANSLAVNYTVAGQATNGTDYTPDLTGTATIAPGQAFADITITPVDDSTVEPNETVTLTLSDTADYDLGSSNTATVTIADNDVVLTPIYQIQGSGTSSSFDGQVVTIEGIVTGDFQNGDADISRNLNGFYVQQEVGDGNAATSDGIFIFNVSGITRNVNAGDRVRITGTVDEFFNETQLTIVSNVQILQAAAVADVSTLAANVTLPTASTIVNADDEYVGDLEQYEGMLVNITTPVTVTELFNLDRFGEFRVSEGERPAQYTQLNDASIAGNQAYLQEVAKRTLTIDDGLTAQNPNPIVYPSPTGITTVNGESIRMGAEVTNLTGNIRFSRGSGGSGDETYRLMPTEAPTFTNTDNPRLDTPEDVGGSLKVASFNVLNYFTTLDTSSSVRTANGFEPRGANSAAEFERQTQKLVEAITALDADVLGLIELENDFAFDGGTAIETLVNRVNTALGSNVYTYIDPGTQFVDDDAISVGIIYKTSAVSIAPGTTIEILRDSDLPGLGLNFDGPVFTGINSGRAPLAVTFRENGTGGVFTVAVNHFKSKSGNGTGDNEDIGDGQGAFNGTRLRSAQALDTWLATDPTGSGDADVLIVGDLNAYAQEDPIQFLANQGYVDLAQRYVGDDAYSYVFDGQTGTLDYTLANRSLNSQTTGATEWHVNSDEADVLDYNLDFGRNPAIFDGTVPFRNSDHDPVLVGLDLNPTQTRTVNLGNGADNDPGSANDDIINAGNGDDTINGGVAGNDKLYGENGNDRLTGGIGRDTLDGGRGNDTLVGGFGDDALTGGQDSDRFVYNTSNEGTDTITDFNTIQDTLDLIGLFDSLGYAGSTPDADGFLRFTQSGSSALVQIDQNGTTNGASFVTLASLNNVNINNLVIGTNVLV